MIQHFKPNPSNQRKPDQQHEESGLVITKPDARKYFDIIDDMLESGDYEWVEERLMSMAEWIEENNHVTEKMKIAVENIRDSRRK